jgi:nickel-dependent lactate racemase
MNNQVNFKNIGLRYGEGEVTFTLPPNAHLLEPVEPEFEITRSDFARNLVQLLPTEKTKFLDVAIVVSDKTRLCGYPEYLPWLTAILIERGAEKKNISFYIAYGTHPRQTEEESLRTYGKIYNEFHFVHHDCGDDTVFEDLGFTHRGTPITVRRDILSATLLITFGSISHHYFAGYGGGRKLLFPGLASRKAIYHNHGLYLDSHTRSLAPGCQPGNVENNPLAADLKEIDAMLPSRISIHGIMNATGRVCRLLAGNTYDDFLNACRIHDGFYRNTSPEKYDLVIASGGGYPRDINFIQAHKAIHHAAAFVKDGGTLVVLAECTDKIGSASFMKYLEAGSFEAAFALLEKNYEGNGGTALSLMIKTNRIRIHLVTSLDHKTCMVLGITKATNSDVQRYIDTIGGSVAVIRNAGMLVK